MKFAYTNDEWEPFFSSWEKCLSGWVKDQLKWKKIFYIWKFVDSNDAGNKKVHSMFSSANNIACGSELEDAS